MSKDIDYIRVINVLIYKEHVCPFNMVLKIDFYNDILSDCLPGHPF